MNHQSYMLEHARIYQELQKEEYGLEIQEMADKIIPIFQQNGVLFVAGNGGSFADAQHFVGELVGGYTTWDRKAMKAIALASNSPTLTATGNDTSFKNIFCRELGAWDATPYILLAMSTSGDSENIIQAVKYAQSQHKTTFGFSGKKGGKLEQLADLCLTVPHHQTNIIQNAHNAMYHRLAELIEAGYTP